MLMRRLVMLLCTFVVTPLWAEADASLASPPKPPLSMEAQGPEEEDEFDRIERQLEQARQVSEGELRFVTPPGQPVHEHHNRVLLDRQSLRTGVVRMEQCHVNLDAVPATAIVYNRDTLQSVRIVRHTGIGRAWVDGPSVELRDVRKGAKICLLAETRALENHGDGRHTLRFGPYMRKFLDGYYPMRVVNEILYPGHPLVLLAQSPPADSGFRVDHVSGGLRYDVWFEGRLEVSLDFTIR
ncbi:MAG: hypothetical protein AB1344_00565 [Pseudomonadota bacterium]